MSLHGFILAAAAVSQVPGVPRGRGVGRATVAIVVVGAAARVLLVVRTAPVVKPISMGRY